MASAMLFDFQIESTKIAPQTSVILELFFRARTLHFLLGHFLHFLNLNLFFRHLAALQCLLLLQGLWE
jgi:hypothetical protein